MIMIFEYRCLDQVVLGNSTRPTIAGKDQDKRAERNQEVVMLIKLSVIDDQLPQVSSSKTNAQVWTNLKDLHETSNKSHAFFHKNMLFLIMMDEKTTLQEHLTKIKDIHDQLEAIGRKMEEEDMVVITLKSLPNSYEHFIETLNITSTNVDLKFPDLCNKLLQQDRWRQQFGSSTNSTSTEQAFSAKSSTKNKGKAQSSQPKGFGSSKDSKKKNVQCNYFHKYGHMKVDCHVRLASEQKKQGGSQQKANVTKH